MKNELFYDLKTEAIKLWNTYDDTHGYASEKIERVQEVQNFADNWRTIWGMFDDTNQAKLLRAVSYETFKFIEENQ